MRRYLVFAVCFVIMLAAGMALGSFVHRQRNMVSFAVNIPDGAVVKVYADLGGDAPFQYDADKPLFTLDSDDEIKTKVGVYDFVIQNKEDYQTGVKKVVVNNATTEVSVQPDFSNTKLALELVQNKDQITGALTAKFNDLATYYNIDKMELYKQGQWAGVTLTPKSSAHDPVRFVLGKKDGGWTVVNSPSIFVLGSEYKSVPGDVVSAVNSL